MKWEEVIYKVLLNNLEDFLLLEEEEEPAPGQSGGSNTPSVSPSEGESKSPPPPAAADAAEGEARSSLWGPRTGASTAAKSVAGTTTLRGPGTNTKVPAQI